LWQQMGETDSILRHPWPAFDEELAREEEIEVPVQVNGKLRALVRVPPGSDNEVLQKAALKEERVQAAIAGKQIVKVVLIPAKLINIVVK